MINGVIAQKLQNLDVENAILMDMVNRRLADFDEICPILFLSLYSGDLWRCHG